MLRLACDSSDVAAFPTQFFSICLPTLFRLIENLLPVHRFLLPRDFFNSTYFFDLKFRRSISPSFREWTKHRPPSSRPPLPFPPSHRSFMFPELFLLFFRKTFPPPSYGRGSNIHPLLRVRDAKGTDLYPGGGSFGFWFWFFLWLGLVVGLCVLRLLETRFFAANNLPPFLFRGDPLCPHWAVQIALVQ